MQERLFFRKYSHLAVGTVLVGLLGLIVFNAFAKPQWKCKLQPAELQNSVIFARHQAAYYEENGAFAKDFDRLEMGTLTGTQQTETKYHHYQIHILDRETVVFTAQPKDSRYKTMVAYDVIGSQFNSSGRHPGIYMVICRSDRSGVPIPKDFRFIKTKTICPTGFTSLHGRDFKKIKSRT
jgi:Type IV pilin-like G and H, putative